MPSIVPEGATRGWIIPIGGAENKENDRHQDRLTKPLIKKEGAFVEATWDEALNLIAEKLGEYKGERFAFLASAKATNEENYLFMKFTRAVMGTNSVDHCARL